MIRVLLVAALLTCSAFATAAANDNLTADTHSGNTTGTPLNTFVHIPPTTTAKHSDNEDKEPCC